MSNYDANLMDWDSAIESDGQQFIVLDEGDYTFTVTGFERGRYPGSAKIPACNKASLTLTIDLPGGQTASCKEDLILYRTLEWKLAAFFRAIGQKKSGERVVMDWSKVLGARGRAHFKPRTYTSNGSEHTTNSVDRYYDFDPQAMSGYDFTNDMEAVAAAIDTAMTSALPQDALASFGTNAVQGLSDAMSSCSMSGTGSTVAASVRTAVNTSLTGSTLRSAGLNAMAGLRAGILAGQSGVISAMRSAARSAVNAAKSELKIHSPSRVFEDEVGVMTMRGLSKGVLKESKAQAKIIRNASRFLTGEAREGTIVAGNTTNTHTYHQDSSVNFTGSTFYIRYEKDVQALAVEIAALTRRRQHGRGLRMA